jgi:nitrogen fixation NifU-like protein
VRYSPETLDHFRAPRGAGAFALVDDRVGQGEGGAVDAGAYVVMQVRVDAAGERIEAARFRGFGCPAVIASASLAVERITGARCDAAERLDADQIVRALHLPSARRASASAVVDALRAALSDVRAKQARQP